MLPMIHQFVSPEKAKVAGFQIGLEQTLTVALPLIHLVITLALVVICKVGIIIGPSS